MANYYVDRVVQYPGRVVMTPVAGETNTYDMSRAEGDVTAEGTRFNAAAFNEIANTIHAYGTCSTAAGTATKVVTCPGFVLNTGATITVYFTNGNTATSSLSMNVNSTGAKNVYGNGEIVGTSRSNLAGAWEQQEAKTFVYDGSYWRMLDNNMMSNDELASLESLLGI